MAASGPTQARKLGLRAGQAAAFVALPESLAVLAEAAAFRRIELAPHWRALPEGARDVIHVFATSAADLRAALPVLRDLILPSGAIWVSWPRDPGKLATDLDADAIRALARADVLDEVKLCSVDAVWSGMKLVVRAEERAAHLNAGMAA